MSAPRVLVLGASGQVGNALLACLRQRGIEVVAVSRQSRCAQPGVDWLPGSLEDMPDFPAELDTWISVGPLDAFALWVARSRRQPRRVVALSSTGRKDKAGSPDAGERDLARRLREAEDSLLSGVPDGLRHVTILRPTLLYGSGRDRSLSRLVSLARRFRFLPLPATASGLRQPVHVDDVAQAIAGCLDAPATFGRAFDLPGGEALGFIDMVRRTLARHAPGARICLLPGWLFAAGAALGRALGFSPAGRGALARLQMDQVADAEPAAKAFGFAPRRFEP